MTVSALFVTVVVLLLLVALIKEMLRPGLILLSGAVVFLVAGILSAPFLWKKVRSPVGILITSQKLVAVWVE